GSSGTSSPGTGEREPAVTTGAVTTPSTQLREYVPVRRVRARLRHDLPVAVPIIHPLLLVPSWCHPDAFSCAPTGHRRSPLVATNRGEVGALAEETRKTLSAPRVIRTPDLLIRRCLGARQHPTSIGHSSSHNLPSARRNSARPSQRIGGWRDASAPHVAG